MDIFAKYCHWKKQAKLYMRTVCCFLKLQFINKISIKKLTNPPKAMGVYQRDMKAY